MTLKQYKVVLFRKHVSGGRLIIGSKRIYADNALQAVEICKCICVKDCRVDDIPLPDDYDAVEIGGK